MKKDTVVVTGLGLMTPLGAGREETWRNLLLGKSGLGWDEPAGRMLGRVPRVSEGQRSQALALWAAEEALSDARLDRNSLGGMNVGCSVSSSKQNLFALNDPWNAFLPDALPTDLARALGLRGGPVRNVVAACATGVHSVILAMDWLREGLCDVALAGSAESSLHPLIMAGFENMGVLSNEVRPFDRRRSGFVMGEGAGVFVIETLEHARNRGAEIYGAVTGWAMGSDASHITRFNSDGRTMAMVLKRAWERGGLDPARVGYLNAHGTATRANDVLETKAIRHAFGSHAQSLSISSTKAATGHLLGAAGSVEFGFSLLALREQAVPPTLNLEDPDPECDLDYTPTLAKPRSMEAVMSLSFGFGGPIGALAAEVVS